MKVKTDIKAGAAGVLAQANVSGSIQISYANGAVAIAQNLAVTTQVNVGTLVNISVTA